MSFDKIHFRSNVFITARERGKIVPSKCHEGHNVWLNLGKTYLPQVISELTTNNYINYMFPGIGGDQQFATITGLLDTHYPGGATFSDTDVTIETLERPIKVTGTPGTTNQNGFWGNLVSAQVIESSPGLFSTVEFTTTFLDTDMHLSSTYDAVPVSELGLVLSDEFVERTSEQVYVYGAPPYIAATRQKLVAYHTFPTITKTPTISLEIKWQIQFD